MNFNPFLISSQGSQQARGLSSPWSDLKLPLTKLVAGENDNPASICCI